MDLSSLSEPLPIESIDFRIQSINKGGYATIIPYKDARVDMQRLDEVCGPLNWKREHNRDNKNCVVSIWDESKNQWVSKEDTGTESYTEQEKGLASDSFKRASFNWGIGTELYDYPFIQVKLNEDEFYLKKVKDRNGKDVEKAYASWKFNLKEWRWHSQFKDGKISFLACKDQKENMRWKWGQFNECA